MDVMSSSRLTSGPMTVGGQTFTVRWYKAAPGAKPFPGAHAFGFPVWDQDELERTGPGFDHMGAWREKDIAAPPGQMYHGRLEWFLDGVPDEEIGRGTQEPCIGPVVNRFSGWSIGTSARWTRTPVVSGGVLVGGVRAQTGGVLAGGVRAQTGGVLAGGVRAQTGGVMAGGEQALGGGVLVGGDYAVPAPGPAECQGLDMALAVSIWESTTGDCSCLGAFPDVQATGIDFLQLGSHTCAGNSVYTLACEAGEYVLTTTTPGLTVTLLSFVAEPLEIRFVIEGYGLMCGGAGGSSVLTIRHPGP